MGGALRYAILTPGGRSVTCEWSTPGWVFDALSAEFGGFEVDVCASAGNARCGRWWSREDNGLTRGWAPSRCWLNPPYGREIGAWLGKAVMESRRGALVVCLVPARTDTAWWHDCAMLGEVRFIRGRLRFGDGRGSAPFPSAVVVFRPGLPG